MNTVMLGKHNSLHIYDHNLCFEKSKGPIECLVQHLTSSVNGQRPVSFVTLFPRQIHILYIAGRELVWTIIFLDDQFPQKWCFCDSLTNFNKNILIPLHTQWWVCHKQVVYLTVVSFCSYFLIFDKKKKKRLEKINWRQLRVKTNIQC